MCCFALVWVFLPKDLGLRRSQTSGIPQFYGVLGLSGLRNLHQSLCEQQDVISGAQPTWLTTMASAAVAEEATTAVVRNQRIHSALCRPCPLV